MIEGPVSNRRFSRRIVRKVIISAIVAVSVLALVIAGWYFYQSTMTSVKQADKQQQEEQARSNSQQIALRISEINTQMAQFAEDPETKSLFMQGSAEQLQNHAEGSVGRFDSALKLRLIRPGEYSLDNENPPLGYGSLDLLGKATETNGAIAAEAFLWDRKSTYRCYRSGEKSVRPVNRTYPFKFGYCIDSTDFVGA